MRDFWFAENAIDCKCNYCGGISSKEDADSYEKQIHVREVSPSLDAAYEACEKALDFIAHECLNSDECCPSRTHMRARSKEALEQLRKAREK